MHILGLILVGLTTAAVWYMRLKALGGAARDVHKIAKRVQNAPRKFAFMHRAGRSGLRAVDALIFMLLFRLNLELFIQNFDFLVTINTYLGILYY